MMFKTGCLMANELIIVIMTMTRGDVGRDSIKRKTANRMDHNRLRKQMGTPHK